MRMWNIKPSLMCNQHLLGEHFEIHKAVGNLKHTGKWTKSLTAKGFLEPQNFVKRHDKLAKEMQKRNMNHKSPLKIGRLKLPKGKVDVNKSIKDIKSRCLNCRRNISLINK